MIDNEYANKEKKPIDEQMASSSHENMISEDELFPHEPISYESTSYGAEPYESTPYESTRILGGGTYEPTYESFQPENETFSGTASSLHQEDIPGAIDSAIADPMANNIAYVQSQQTMPSAIGADYYNITDQEGWPIASLLVLLDGAKQPVRAEIHVHTELSQSAYEDTIYQGYKLLQTNYGSNEPLPLRILQTYQHGESFDVPLSAARPQARRSVTAPQFDWNWSRDWSWDWGWDWKPLAFGLGGLLGIILLISGISRFFSGGGEVSEIPIETPVVEATAIVPSANAGDVVNTPIPPQSGTSINAHPGIAIGSRVRIRPGYMLSLRSEPSASQGDTLGYMENLQEAIVLDGPVMTEGDKDTIVWWFVSFDDRRAWAAANTSELTLLEPIE